MKFVLCRPFSLSLSLVLSFPSSSLCVYYVPCVYMCALKEREMSLNYSCWIVCHHTSIIHMWTKCWRLQHYSTLQRKSTVCSGCGDFCRCSTLSWTIFQQFCMHLIHEALQRIPAAYPSVSFAFPCRTLSLWLSGYQRKTPIRLKIPLRFAYEAISVVIWLGPPFFYVVYLFGKPMIFAFFRCRK